MIQTATATFAEDTPLYPAETGQPSVVVTWPVPFGGPYHVAIDAAGSGLSVYEYSKNATTLRLRSSNVGDAGTVRVFAISDRSPQDIPIDESNDWSSAVGATFTADGTETVAGNWKVQNLQEQAGSRTATVGHDEDEDLDYVKLSINGGTGSQGALEYLSLYLDKDLQYAANFTAIPTLRQTLSWRMKFEGNPGNLGYWGLSCGFMDDVTNYGDYPYGWQGFYLSWAHTNAYAAWTYSGTYDEDLESGHTTSGQWRDYRMEFYGAETERGIAEGDKWVIELWLDDEEPNNGDPIGRVVQGDDANDDGTFRIMLWNYKNKPPVGTDPVTSVYVGPITVTRTPGTTLDVQMVEADFGGSDPTDGGFPYVDALYEASYADADAYRILVGIKTTEDLMDVSVNLADKTAGSARVFLSEQANATVTLIAIPVGT